jgi:hypothetical protein
MERARASSAAVERFEAAREERDRRAGEHHAAAREAWLRWTESDL